MCVNVVYDVNLQQMIKAVLFEAFRLQKSAVGPFPLIANQFSVAHLGFNKNHIAMLANE